MTNLEQLMVLFETEFFLIFWLIGELTAHLSSSNTIWNNAPNVLFYFTYVFLFNNLINIFLLINSSIFNDFIFILVYFY